MSRRTPSLSALLNGPKGNISRRSLLAGGLLFGRGAIGAGRGGRVDSPPVDILDPLTEREMQRLTDPAVLHHLQPSSQRVLNRRNSLLLLAGESDGSRQIYAYELNRGRMTQLSEGPGTHPHSATLDSRDRQVFYLQANALYETSTTGDGRTRIYEAPSDWTLTGDLGLSSTDDYAAAIEVRADDWSADPLQRFKSRPRCRVRIIPLDGRRESWVAAEERRWIGGPQFRPGRQEILYVREGPSELVDGRLRWTSLDGKRRESLTPRQGKERIGRAFWSADGAELLYVYFPDETGRRSQVRAVSPDSGAQRTVAACSGFGWMSGNRDGTVIVGASLRPSGPNLYVLFPKLSREMTLCEHSSSLKPYPLAGTTTSDPASADPDPVLSHNSQWVYFTTDREGLPAVYRMKIDDLVSET